MPFDKIPLSEQQRVVDRIERLFAKLDEVKEKAQIVVDGFKTRKAAILHKAFAGKLTKWRRDYYRIHDEGWETRELLKNFEIIGGIQKTPLRIPQITPFPI